MRLVKLINQKLIEHNRGEVKKLKYIGSNTF
jgi:hypothetical protein